MNNTDTDSTENTDDYETDSNDNDADQERGDTIVTEEQEGNTNGAVGEHEGDSTESDSEADTDTDAEPDSVDEDPETVDTSTTDEQVNDDDDSVEEIVPELHDDVYQAPFEGYDVENPSELSDAVGQIDSQASITIEQLIRRIETLEEEVEMYKEKAQQKQKEFQQFKERKTSETEKLRETATKEFIRDALPIRDNLVRALEQDSDDIVSGVELIRKEFDDLLESEGVTIIEPESGSSVNPELHEVMTRVDSDVEEGKVTECFRPGYKIEDVIIRPARVTVSSGSQSD